MSGGIYTYGRCNIHVVQVYARSTIGMGYGGILSVMLPQRLFDETIH